MKAQIALFLSLVLTSFAVRADFEVYFLRHGETTWNRARLLQGSVAGTVLTPKGERMAEATAAGMTAAGIAFDRVYTSPYTRARRTAEIVSEKGGFARPVDEPRIREMCFGTYEGFKYVRGRYVDDNLRKFFEGEDGYEPRGEGAESFGQVQARLRDFLENELKPLDGKVARVLCVAHSLILKSLVRELAGASAPASAKKTIQPNCCVHVVKFADGKFSLGETGRIFYDPAAFAGPSGPLMVAHRGDYPDCPEGSRPAYSNAVARASDIVKLDVNPSRDGVTIMSHDRGFKRTMGWDVKIGDVDYAEILKHEFLPKGAFAHERAVMLPEALAIVKYVPEFWIDFKTFTPAFCEQVLRQFSAAGIDRGRIMCATYTTAALEYLKTRHPDIRRVGHMDFRLQDGRWSPSFLRSKGVTYAPAAAGEPYAPELLQGILDYAKRLGLHGVNMCPNAEAVTPGLVAKLKESGFWVSIALIHTRRQAETFARHGHDCVVTGDVRVVRPVMADAASCAFIRSEKGITP